MSEPLYPLLFSPVLKDYIWGGRTLASLGRDLPADGVVAESWEIAAHDNGTTVVRNGRFAGQPLTAVQQQLGLDLIGRNSAWAQARGKFPLLVKLLDAKLPLSVQVHPEDDYALAHEGNELGKTEMWVVLAADPGAEIILGVQAGTTKEAFRAALEAGELEPLLHHVPIKAGDHICIPAGSLHALMGGALIAETLQNSDTTYRVYDWNRVGTDGHPRPLHIDKALDVINFAQVEPTLSVPQPLGEEAGVKRALLCQNRYFSTERVTMDVATRWSGKLNGSTFEIWGALDGKVRVNEVELTAVQFCLLPAALGRYTITAETPATLLRTYVS